MGAWIETGVKSGLGIVGGVAPHVGAWIETGHYLLTHVHLRRTPRGCVD